MPPASVSTRKPEHDGDVGHRLGAAVADRGQPGEAQREEGDQLEDAGQHQEERPYQEVSDSDAVLISGPEEGPDVCSLGCGQGFPRQERDGGSITSEPGLQAPLTEVQNPGFAGSLTRPGLW